MFKPVTVRTKQDLPHFDNRRCVVISYYRTNKKMFADIEFECGTRINLVGVQNLICLNTPGKKQVCKLG